jgi:hypothetical protein
MTTDAEVRTWINQVWTNNFEDIQLAMNPGKPNGGYWSTLLLIFCSIDFFGTILSGEGKHETRNAIKFIKKYFSIQNPRYEKIGGLLYAIFRHGLVHTARPKKFTINSQEFFHVVGKDTDLISTNDDSYFIWKKEHDGDDQIYCHLIPKLSYPSHKRSKESSGILVFPISLPQLFHDYKKAVHCYLKDLETDANLRGNARKIYVKIREPTRFTNLDGYVNEYNPLKNSNVKNRDIDISEFYDFSLTE